MAQTGSILLRLPSSIKKNEVIKVMFAITHPMDTGRVKDKKTGNLIPAHHLTDVECFFDNEKFSHLKMTGAVSQNPFFSIKLKVVKSGTLRIAFKDNKGGSWDKTETITV